MLQFVWHRIKNKKWLNLCLLAGISLLAAVFACHPMFEKGADSSLLQTGFTDYADEHNEFPAAFERSGSYDTKEYQTAQAVYDRMDAYEAKWIEYVDVDPVISQQCLKLSGENALSNLGRANYFLSIGLLRDMDAHIQLVKGKGLTEENESDSGSFPCLVSESVMDTYGLVVGEEINFPYSKNAQGEPVRFVITGIFTEAPNQDNYWYHDLTYYDKQIFVSEETFDTLIAEYGYSAIQFEDAMLINYTQINGNNALDYLGYIREFQKADTAFYANFFEMLESYEVQQKTVRTILWVLELPCIVLLLLFLYMVSNQVLSVEEGEIAVLRSRGATKGQTMLLYILQALILSVVGMFAGTALGFFLCKGAAQTDAFLHFVRKDADLYSFTWKMLLYAAIACMIAMLFMTLPVWKRAKLTIVEQKSRGGSTDKKPFWEKCFLDMILLGVSCYLFYNYNKQSEELAYRVIAGERMDPMIFLDASLFIFSCGLVFLRLTKYLVMLINKIGKKRWKPAMYASFLQITRTFHKQSFISIFLVMTIASGIFDANMARTMNENSEKRIAYNVGTDVRLLEMWNRREKEPNFEEYSELTAEGICESVTRVLEDNNVDITATVAMGNKTLSQCQMMGIWTKEFGETAELQDGLNDTHWFYALNALAENANSVIISRNTADTLRLKVGDQLSYTRYNSVGNMDAIGSVDATVCAIVDGFPGYERYRYTRDEEGNVAEEENYLVVANYATVVSNFKTTPYSVWMRLSKGTSVEQVKAFLEEHDISLTSWMSMEEEIAKNKSSALIQITNGMFTMTFFISILICSVGFLIYWIMSIQSREALFGIYRAMGMRMKEIHRMLINEQMFGSLLPILAGGGAGALGTLLFVKLTTLVYLPQKHNISIRISIYGWDMAKLFLVIFAVVLVCFFVLRRLLQRMKIAQALKLGED